MPTLIESKTQEVAAKRATLAKMFETHKAADGRYDFTAAQRDEVKSLNDELNGMGKELEILQADARVESDNRKALEGLNNPNMPGPFAGEMKGFDHRTGHDPRYGQGQPNWGLGDLLIKTPGYQDFIKSRSPSNPATPHFSAYVESDFLKTTFTTSAGWSPFVPRLPGAVLSPQQQPKVIDLVPTAETSFASIKYMLESTYTNSAAGAAETGTYAESAFALTETTVPVVKISHFVPTTDEQVADVPQARDYLNGRLELGLRQKLDSQMVTGSGSGANLIGFLNTASINTRTQGTDNTPDAFYKAMITCMYTGFANPSGIVMNPLDWQGIRLTKTSQGLYLWGNPDSEGPQRMWGLPVVTTTYMTQGTGLVGDFAMFSTLYFRKGVTIEVTNSHASFFITGQLAVRADLRASLVVNRATAFTTVTSIPAVS